MTKNRLPDQTNRPRRLRRFLLATGLLLLIVAGFLVGFLPDILSSSSGNRTIEARLNSVLAPGKLSIGRIQLSWFRPTQLTDVVLADAQGLPTLTARSGSINRSLWQMIANSTDLGVLQLDETNVELKRRPDGSINLIEALGRAFDHPNPKRDFTIRILGRLNLNDQGLRHPINAEKLAFELKLLPLPRPLSWSLTLKEPSLGSLGTLQASGDFDRWRRSSRVVDLPDLSAEIKTAHWPWTTELGEASTTGTLDGELSVKRESARWTSTGKAGLLVTDSSEAEAAGSQLQLGWNSWTEGNFLKVGGRASSDRLGRLDGPFSLDFAAGYSAKDDRAEVSSFALSTVWAKLEADGKIESLTGKRLVDLKGKFTPDYQKITRHLASTVEPEAKVAGSAADWSVKGPLARSFDSEAIRDLELKLGFALDHVDIYGMKLGATKFLGQVEAGSVRISPIETTLNGGVLKLSPTIDLSAPGAPVVRLGSDTSLQEAEINDEVSRRVLSFVAPVLNQATQVNGKVSAELASAEFPIARGAGKKAKVEGVVEFRDVTFAAGPLSKELLSLVIRDPAKLDSSKLVLDQPVRLSIANGRIDQRGLGLPVGKLARIEVEGWVDFERKIGLEATIPLNPELFAKAPLLNGVARATRVRIPISGTLDQPRLDTSALKSNFSQMGRDLLIETGAQGIAQIFSKLAQPRDPNAPPPPPRMTAEERKAKRLEKKAERRAKANGRN